MSVSVCCRRFPLTIQSRLLLQPTRNGYIVLLPEINPEVAENAALMKDNMPDFTNLTTEKCITTVGKHLLDFEQGVRLLEQSVEKAGCTNIVKEIIEPIEKINAKLETSWGIVKNLYLTKTQLMPATTYVPLHHRATRAHSAKFYSKAIYSACKECDQTNMTEEDQRVVDKYVLEGRLAGLELDGDKTKELATVRMKLNEYQSRFNKRVEASSTMYEERIYDMNITRDMPDQLLKLMAVNKEEPSRGPWIVNLNPQIQKMFLAYCSDRNLRFNFWQAKTRVASQSLEQSQYHNSRTLEKIRYFRKEEAKLLGYESYAHMSMDTKMAGSLENIQDTLGYLLSIAKPAADKELIELQQFAWDRGFEGTLQVWDVPYWERKQKRTLFNYKEEMLNDYFPFDKVWTGLLAMAERLFDIKVVENNKIDRWHPDVRFYYIFEEDSNKPIAGFYLDPYIREDKLLTDMQEPWAVSISPATRIHKGLPLSSLVLHLGPPIFGKPALLSWSEVESLFQQFGRILQQLLTKVNYSEVAGLSNVEWDAVEIVQNVFLHWLREPEVLASISGHYASGEKLPPLPLVEIERHFAGHRLSEELYKARLDLEMYSTEEYWQDIMKRIWPSHFILQYDKFDSTPCSFTEIVTGQWCAAYFSHVWARMVAADVYSAFTEQDADPKSVSTRFRDTYLSFGGSCHPGEVFRRFRGRDPSSEAYLKHLGLN